MESPETVHQQRLDQWSKELVLLRGQKQRLEGLRENDGWRDYGQRLRQISRTRLDALMSKPFVGDHLRGAPFEQGFCTGVAWAAAYLDQAIGELEAAIVQCRAQVESTQPLVDFREQI